MRIMMNVKFPNHEFNAALRNGTLSKLIERILDSIKPESVYFSEQNGRRGCVMVVNVKEPSEIPKIAEPFFLCLNADVEFGIAMTPEDLRKANLEEITEKW